MEFLFYPLLIANSLYIIGLHNAAKFEYKTNDHPELGIIENSKMILWRLRLFCLNTFGKFYSKGLITCPPCMALTHSTYIFSPLLIFVKFNPIDILIYVLYVGALSALNYIIMMLIEMIEAIRDKNNNS